MQTPGKPIVLLAVLFALGAMPQGTRAAYVRLEIIADSQAAAMDLQKWSAALGQAGVRNVQLRSARAGDKIGISTEGDPAKPDYVVIGTLSGNELVLPGARFRQSDLSRLVQWLEDLAEQGPPEQRETRGVFGLTGSQFEKARLELKPAVDFATAAVPRVQAVDRIMRLLTLPVDIDPQIRQAIGEAPVGAELKGLSRGTAIAYLLRPAGCALLPRIESGRLELQVVRPQRGTQVWPVGWEPVDDLRTVLPAIHEFHNVNVSNVPVVEVLKAIGKQMNTPVLYDENALVQHGIEPEKALVSMPAGRTTYSLAMRKLLFQAGLKFDVRVDESQSPFIWVTSIKPL